MSVARRPVALSCVLCLLLAWAGGAQERQEQAPSAALGRAREVAVTPLAGQGGLAVRVALDSGAPDGSVVSAVLVEEEQPPPVAAGQGGVRGGAVVVLLRLPERAAPGLYDALLAYDPTAQPRWVAGRAAPARRAIPVAFGTVAEAQAARDQATSAAAACADAAADVAAVVAQAFGPRAARWSRAALQDFLRERAVPRALRLEQALEALRPTRPLAREEAPLRAIGRRALAALAARARAACLEQEVPLPSLFAAGLSPREQGGAGGAGAGADDAEALLVEALAVRDLARRGGLAPEPSPLTLERLARRAAWLAAAADAPADAVRPEVLAYVLGDARQALGRVRPALVTLESEQGVAAAVEALGAADAALAAQAPDPSALAASAERWRALTAQAGGVLALVRRRHLADDRAALLDLRARLAEAAASPPIAAAWRRGLAVVERRLATAPAPARALVTVLAEMGEAVASGRPVAAEVEARWSQALVALDAVLGGRP